jgi:hypothetical protein
MLMSRFSLLGPHRLSISISKNWVLGRLSEKNWVIITGN